MDGWLLYDFHGLNPVAVGMLELPGMTTRRFFVYIPREGSPVAITHNIEQGPWINWPRDWRKEKYSSWRALESLLGSLVKGKRVAMEYSPGDAVPYLDRVPAGVIEMVRSAGGTSSSIVLPIISPPKASLARSPTWRTRKLRPSISPVGATSHRTICSRLWPAACGWNPPMDGKAALAASTFHCVASARWLLDRIECSDTR